MTAPKKRGPRTFDGLVMDVATTGAAMGDKSRNVKATRNLIERGILPHRRLGGPHGRIIVIRSELDAFLKALPGVSADEAIENVKARAGGR